MARRDELEAGVHVGEAGVVQDVGREGRRAAAHGEPERGVAGVEAEDPHAEDVVGDAVEDGREHGRDVGGRVLEVGVEDDQVRARGVGHAGAHGRALAAVAGVLDQPDPAVGERLEPRPGPVGRAVVDDDDLGRARVVDVEHAPHRGEDRRRLVVDGHDDGQLGHDRVFLTLVDPGPHARGAPERRRRRQGRKNFVRQAVPAVLPRTGRWFPPLAGSTILDRSARSARNAADPDDPYLTVGGGSSGR